MLQFFMAPTWLIYHPTRECSALSKKCVAYHDSLSSNQDPYIWNKNFLHSFCHAPEVNTRKKNQINFWVSGDSYPKFTKLFCDLVFVVDMIYQWENANSISRENPIVDNDLAYEHHYKFGNLKAGQSHYFKIKKRYTFKAHSTKSFQPQDTDRKLIDIMPFLVKHGLSLSTLHQKMSLNKDGTNKKSAKPFLIDSNIGHELYKHLKNNAVIKLTGTFLADKYPKRSQNCP